MKKLSKIPLLQTYTDWLIKAQFELERYQQTYNVYDMTNCLLTLNALPEWIVKSEDCSSGLREHANKKNKIMTSHKLNLTNLEEIDNLLRIIRLFCNHAKHNETKKGFVKISMSASFPISYPMRFENLTIGEDEKTFINVENLLIHVINFWDNTIKELK